MAKETLDKRNSEILPDIGTRITVSTEDTGGSTPGFTRKITWNTVYSWIVGKLKSSEVTNDSSVIGSKVKDALNTLLGKFCSITSDNVANDSLLAIGATVTAAIDFIMGLFINYPLWSILANTEYTAIPATANTITTSSDTSTKFNIGDVLRVEQTGALIRYVKVQNITPTLITVFGDLLIADIVSIRYERGNNAAIQQYKCVVGSDEIYRYGTARPFVRATNSGALAAPANTNYGTDLYYDKQLKVEQGTLVYARYTAHSLDSSAIAAEFEMKFGANTVVTWSIDSRAGDSEAIVGSYASTDTVYPVVNVTNPSGNKVAEGIKLYFEIFSDKDPV